MATIKMELCGDVLVTTFRGDGLGPPCPGIKKEVSEFTQRSRSALCKYLRGAEAQYRAMLTLTLPAQYDNELAKAYLKNMIERIRRLSAGVPKWSICWWMEFQARGAMHFHCLVTHFIDHNWAAHAWAQIVDARDDGAHERAGINIEAIRVSQHGLAKYAMKYAAKTEQKELPANRTSVGFGRWWGVAGLRRVVAAVIIISPQAAKKNSVRACLRQIRTYLDDGVAQKTVFTRKYDYCEVWAIRSAETTLKIGMLMKVAQCASGELLMPNDRNPALHDAELDNA